MSTQANPPPQNPEYIARLLQSRQQYLLDTRKKLLQEVATIEAELTLIKTELEARQCAPQS